MPTDVVDGSTVTLATGTMVTVTVTVDDPDTPSLVAAIVAVPAALPVTTPPGLTVATASLLDVQTTIRSVTTVPLASLTVAKN